MKLILIFLIWSFYANTSQAEQTTNNKANNNAQTKTKAQPNNKANNNTQSETENKDQTKAKAQPKNKAETQTENKDQTKAKAQPKNKAKTKTKTKTKAPTKAQSKAKSPTKAETQSETENKDQTKAKAQPKNKAKTKAPTKAQSKAKSPTKAKTQSETENKDQPKAKAQGEDEDIIQNLTEELNFLNQQTTPPSPSKEKSALEYMKHNKHKKAIDLLESLEDNSSRSLLILAQAYENTGDHENQIRVLRQLIKKDKKNGTYLLELAKGLRQRYFKTGRFEYRDSARETIKQVLTLDKKYREKAHLEMLALLKYKEDSEETNYAILKLLQTLLREFGLKRSYIKDICKYFYINKYYSQSLSGCKKAMRYDPLEPDNYVYYALSHESPDDVEKHLKTAAKKFPKSTFAQESAGQFFIEQKDYKSARLYFQNAVSSAPQSAQVQLGLAQALFHTGKEDQSYKHFLKACMLNKPKMLWAFKQAKSILNQKSKFKLATSFENGITKCFLRAKYKKQPL